MSSKSELLTSQIQSFGIEVRPLTAVLKGKPEITILTPPKLKNEFSFLEVTHGITTGDFLQNYMLGLPENMRQVPEGEMVYWANLCLYAMRKGLQAA